MPRKQKQPERSTSVVRVSLIMYVKSNGSMANAVARCMAQVDNALPSDKPMGIVYIDGFDASVLSAEWKKKNSGLLDALEERLEAP